MARDIFIRTDVADNGKARVRSFTDDTSPDPLIFTRSDDSLYRFHLLKTNPSQESGRPFVYDEDIISLKVAAGIIDAAPTDGTFVLTDPDASQDTAAIAYNASAATVQTAIRAALTTNFALAVVSGANGGPWTIDIGETGVIAWDLTGNEDGLSPSGSTVDISVTQQGTLLLRKVWQVRLRTGQPFYCEDFVISNATTTAASVLQSGSSTANKVYNFTWLSTVNGGSTQWAVSTDGSDIETIGPIPYNATADEVAALVNLHGAIVDDPDLAVRVQRNGAGSYTVTFPLSLGNTPTIGATAAVNKLTAPRIFSANIGVATGPSDAILGTEEDAPITFEAEARREAGKPLTICQEAATLEKDLIGNAEGVTTGSAAHLTTADLANISTTLDATVVKVSSSFNSTAANPLLLLQPSVSGFAGTVFSVKSWDGDTLLTINEDGILSVPAGTVGMPAINFGGSSASTDTDTGFYWISDNTFGIATGGVLRATFSNGGLTLNAGFVAPITAKTANYTLTSADFTVLADCTGGNVTLTLPAAASNTGRIFNIIRTDGSGNDVIIDGNASEQIDGSATRTLGVSHRAAIQSDGTGWHTISKYDS